MKILIVGKNSMVARSFIPKYEAVYDIEVFGAGDKTEDYAGRKYDAVVFLAQSAQYKQTSFEADLYKVNIGLLFKVLHTIETPKFIYFSTGSVYAQTQKGRYTETDALNISDPFPYVASKIAGEVLVNSYKPFINSVTILRPFYIYGKHQKDIALIKSLYNKLMNGEQIKIKGKEGFIFNPVYVADVADLLHLILSNEGAKHAVYNVGGKEEISLRQLVTQLAGVLNVEANIQSDGGDEQYFTIGETNIPGWAAGTSVKQGLTKTFVE